MCFFWPCSIPGLSLSNIRLSVVVYLILYHPFFAMLMVSYWRTICASSCSIPGLSLSNIRLSVYDHRPCWDPVQN